MTGERSDIDTRGRASVRHEDIAASDRRWLLVTCAVFCVTLLLLFALYQLYTVSGPHHDVLLLLRGVTRLAHWLLPGV